MTFSYKILILMTDLNMWGKKTKHISHGNSSSIVKINIHFYLGPIKHFPNNQYAIFKINDLNDVKPIKSGASDLITFFFWSFTYFPWPRRQTKHCTSLTVIINQVGNIRKLKSLVKLASCLYNPQITPCLSHRWVIWIPWLWEEKGLL